MTISILNSSWRLIIWSVAILAIAAAAVQQTIRSTRLSEIQGAGEQLQQQLDSFADRLQSQLQWYEIPPSQAAEATSVTELVQNPDSATLRDAANVFLEKFAHTFSHQAQARSFTFWTQMVSREHPAIGKSRTPSLVRIMASGLTLRQPSQGGTGGTGHYVALGATSKSLGYYVSKPIILSGAIKGVVAVKYTPNDLLAAWHVSKDILAIADENGVIFGSSNSELLFHTLSALPAETIQVIQQNKQYPPSALALLNISNRSEIGNVPVGRLSLGSGPAAAGSDRPSGALYAIQQQRIPAAGWHLVALANIEESNGHSASIIGFGVLGATVALFLLAHFEQRRRARETLTANEAQLRAILEGSPIGATVTTEGGKLLTWGGSGQAHSFAPAAGVSPVKRGEAQRSRERSDLDAPAAGYTVASERALARSWLPLWSLLRSFILALRISFCVWIRSVSPSFACSLDGRITSHPVELVGSDHNPSCSRASGSGWRDHSVNRRVSAREFRGHRPPGSGEAAFSFAGVGGVG